jgi:transcriptional regulator GlxA family with amidase domain
MADARTVVIAVFDDVELLDVTGPAQVFSAASRIVATRREAAPRAGYAVRLAGPRAGPIRTSSGVSLVADVAFEHANEPVDTIVVPGAVDLGATGPQPLVVPEVVEWVARSARTARRVASVCVGAHMLAAAGLLDGRKATTHWYTAARLAADFPAVRVEPDPIFIRSGSVWTCAGVSSGMDLALAMVAEDHGDAVALATARWLVMYLKRPGGQSQFSVPLSTRAPSRDDVGALQLWMADNVSADLSVPALAQRLHLSERHFIRVFREQTGTTPAAYVDAIRLEAARRMLEETDAAIETVAASCGFGSAETLYRSFRRRLAATPTEYRRRFRSPVAAEHLAAEHLAERP